MNAKTLRFTDHQERQITIGIGQVVAVMSRLSDTTMIFLASGDSIEVKGSHDEVMRQVHGES